MSVRLPVIHIGLPKTATKTLQWRLLAQHKEIFYLGRFDGPQFRKEYRKFSGCRNANIKKLMDELVYINITNPDFHRCSSIIQEVLAPAVEDNLVPVWSWESLSTDVLAKRRQRARNLKRVFGQAKILVTIRHPLRLIESAFLQQVKRENVGPGARLLKPVYFPAIDDWIEKEWDREVKYHLEYPETIRAFSDFFGLDLVNVAVFEELSLDARSFFSKICDIIGISISDGLALVIGRKDNNRWTIQQISALERIKASRIKSLFFRLSSRKKRREKLDLESWNLPRTMGPSARFFISDKWRDKIIQRTSEGNRWISDIFNLPLDQYGYFHG